MKNYLCLLLLLPIGTYAQKEGNFWTFGYCNSINFNSGSPVYGGVPGTGINVNSNISFNRSNVVADANGRLLFYAKLTEYDKRLLHNATLYDSNGDPMANSELAIASPVVGPVQIAQKPGDAYNYYVIYSLNHALLYTRVDMRLNNGLGGVVTSEKSVMLSGWQTIVGEKTAIVQGCDGLWLVVRSRTANQYLSYKINASGIDHQPVVSECGLLPLNAYFEPWCNYNPGDDGYGGMTRIHNIGAAGFLRSAPDGSKVVAACCGGLELYHFSKCSGKLSAPVLVDTVNIIEVNYTPFCRFRTAYPKVYFNSACFSPDNSKLYASYFLLPYVFQYDLNVPREQIISTKTRVLTNQPTRSGCLSTCMFIDTIGLDDLKLGPDGKIYIPNNGQPPCTNTSISNVGQMADWTLHVINNPNLPGLACNPQHNALILGPLNGGSKFATLHTLNPPIVLPSPPPDTTHRNHFVSLCSGDALQGDPMGDCYRWNTGAVDTSAISITKSGLYIAHYFKNCSYHIDSFQVSLPPFPKVDLLQYGCPEALALTVHQNAGDTCVYQYQLTLPNGNSRIGSSSSGYLFHDLIPGVYLLKVSSIQGCDTLYKVILEYYPTPNLETQPSDTTITYGQVLQMNAKGATSYIWSPANTLDNSSGSNPIARPKERTLYQVIGWNDYGCPDTGYVIVRLDYSLPDMMPNAFSPNGDGLNDVFRPSGITYQKIHLFQVFNRLGQMIYYATGIDNGWDGSYQNKACDAGTYYYQVELEYPDGKTKQIKGDVILIR